MTRRVPYAPDECPRCHAVAPCVDWNEVDIGVGVQTFEPQYECPHHGRFAWAEQTLEQIGAGIPARAIFQIGPV